jgi:hypothetical protein
MTRWAFARLITLKIYGHRISNLLVVVWSVLSGGRHFAVHLVLRGRRTSDGFLSAAVITPLMRAAAAGFVYWLTSRQDRRDAPERGR